MVVLVVGPSLLHLSSQGEPGVVLRPCTTENGPLSKIVARTIASIFGPRGPQSLDPAMIPDSDSNSLTASAPPAMAREKIKWEDPALVGAHNFMNWQLERSANRRPNWGRRKSFFFSVTGGIVRVRRSRWRRGAGKHLVPAACSVNCLVLGCHVPSTCRIKLTPHGAAASALRTHRLEVGDGPLSSQQLAVNSKINQGSW